MEFPITSNSQPGFKSVYIHRARAYHIIFSIDDNATASISLFNKIKDDIIGFDMEYVPNNKYAFVDHIHGSSAKEIVCTIQFGCKDMSLIFCLPWIYKNDKTSNVLPPEIHQLLNETLVCFGGNNDIRILKSNFPGETFECKIIDPIIKLTQLGANRPNLISMAEILLGIHSTKETPNIDWMNASTIRLTQAGDDAILSLLIYQYMQKTSDEVMAKILVHHNLTETTCIRKEKIQACNHVIIRKIMNNLNDDTDCIATNKYISAMYSFLGTMKLPQVHIVYMRNIDSWWTCNITVDLEHVQLHDSGTHEQKKAAYNMAIRNVLKQKLFKEALEKFL